MAISTQPYKGARDFYPEDMRRQKWMFNKLRDVVEKFGYEEYNAPLLEPLEIYTAKTGDEIVNQQTYAFEDRGGRQVAVRPEMTPSVSRMVAAKRQELPYPMRLFNIGNRWRYERPQRGRVREFWQLDVDLFGVASIDAEVEMIQIVDQIMQNFGATEAMYEIRINSRQLLNKKIEAAGLKPKTKVNDVIRLIDKKDKISADDFKSELEKLVIKPASLLDFFEASDVSQEFGDFGQRLKAAGIKNLRFVPTIARGFDYYTDIVFEVFDKNPENNRSMFGGGRYSGLVGLFGVEPIEAIGFAMGDVTLTNFLEANNLLPELNTETDIYLIPIGDLTDEVTSVANELRQKGLKVAVDFTKRKTDKQLKVAIKKGVPYVLFIGDKEISEKRYRLKKLATAAESTGKVEDIVKLVKG
jgi:histidyl-tRNA synthetase